MNTRGTAFDDYSRLGAAAAALLALTRPVASVLRAAWARRRPGDALSLPEPTDRQLRDIGLTTDQVVRRHERSLPHF